MYEVKQEGRKEGRTEGKENREELESRSSQRPRPRAGDTVDERLPKTGEKKKEKERKKKGGRERERERTIIGYHPFRVFLLLVTPPSPSRFIKGPKNSRQNMSEQSIEDAVSLA